jgi:lysine decarboxylase
VRLAVDVRGTGASGHRVADLMRELSDVNVELYTGNIVEAMFGMGSDAERDADRLVASLEAALGALDEADRERRRRLASPPPWGALRMTPREAFLGPQESVSFAKAEGRIAAESLAAYPPGVPNVLPGEELTQETIQYVTDTLSAGGQVRGAGDQTLETVRVVANP